jgi:KaiC/GvpD/RAD55 family RecA-like ATPase
VAGTPLAKIIGRMQDMETEIISKTFFGMIYGGFGTGKTTLVAGIARALMKNFGGRTLYLDSAENFASLENIPSLMKGLDRIQVKEPKDLMTIAEALKKRKAPFDQHTVLILDEVDAWFEVILHNYVREVTGTLSTDDLPEIEGKMYAAPTQATLNILNTFKSVDGLHIIMVAHDQQRGKEPKIFTAPSLPPKLMKGLNEKAHVVGLVEAVIKQGGYERTLQVNPSKQVVAKTRIGNLPVKIDFKDVPRIFADWVGSDRMEEDLVAPEPDPDPVDDADIDVEEPDDLDEDEATEVSDDED